MSEARPRHVVYGIWLIIASVVGWWAAFQLTVEKFILLENPGDPLACDISPFLQCSTNLGSWQGEVFGFPNPLLGLTGWMAPLVVGVALIAGARFPRWFWALFGAGITFAFGFVCWLIGQTVFELFVLCPWCLITWAVTIPTFLATMVHLVRNGTFTRNEKVTAFGAKAMSWVPLATFLAYALVILLMQVNHMDFLGAIADLLF
ncbi:vitamin K epoxide reductase family protein [Microbacterium sp. NPDC055903]